MRSSAMPKQEVSPSITYLHPKEAQVNLDAASEATATAARETTRHEHSAHVGRTASCWPRLHKHSLQVLKKQLHEHGAAGMRKIDVQVPPRELLDLVGSTFDARVPQLLLHLQSETRGRASAETVPQQVYELS